MKIMIMKKTDNEIFEKELLIESILFLAGRPVSIDEMCKITKLSKTQIKKEVEKLKKFYSGRAIEIRYLGNDVYEMRVKSKYLGRADKILPEKEFSTGVLKTLAYISFKSPVKQSEIIKFIGKKAYDHINELLEKGYIKAEKKGNTKILKITKKLLKYFNLKSEKQLKDYFKKLKIEDVGD